MPGMHDSTQRICSCSTNRNPSMTDTMQFPCLYRRRKILRKGCSLVGQISAIHGISSARHHRHIRSRGFVIVKCVTKVTRCRRYATSRKPLSAKAFSICQLNVCQSDDKNFTYTSPRFPHSRFSKQMIFQQLVAACGAWR